MPEKDKRINVLFAAAEAEPFIKVGGLGDVAGALPIAIQKSGPQSVDIRLVMPFHAAIKEKQLPINRLGSFAINSGLGTSECSIYTITNDGLTVYFLDSEAINHESPVYHANPVQDGRKYAFFSVACVELVKFLNWEVDIFHANDWHTAVALYALATNYKDEQLFHKTAKIISVHNMPFNGYGAQPALTELGIVPSNDSYLPEWARLTPLPLGLVSADKIIAVSEGYAKEILTPEFGCGLDEFLKTRSERIIGIVNGIDTHIWDPVTDPYLVQNYNQDNLGAKAKNKAALQKSFDLDINPNIPLLTLISRMDNQKGIDIALRGLNRVIGQDWQAIILGTGNPQIEKMASNLAQIYPERIKTVTKFDPALSHQLYAGADIFLMPSRYEPCGISQMISMRYGTIPVARATGGLEDTITHYRGNTEEATGFLFKHKYPSAFANGLLRALNTYKNKPVWARLQQNGMNRDFSWQRSAEAYVEVYKSLLK